jgi:hypothetical protein
MTTDNNPNPANEPATFPPIPKESPTKPGLPDEEGDKKIQQVADRLAHKGAKREQDFDKDNTKLFSN